MKALQERANSTIKRASLGEEAKSEAKEEEKDRATGPNYSVSSDENNRDGSEGIPFAEGNSQKSKENSPQEEKDDVNESHIDSEIAGIAYDGCLD